MLTDTPPRLPALGSLRAFEAAARHRSMVAAAAELNVTHGAISKQVQALEDELGTRLFERRNRGIHLTRRGEWLAQRLEAAFTDLHRTMRDFRKLDDAAGPLTVSCEPTLCLRLLIPALGELKQATDLDVRVLAAGGPIDFARDHVDLAIRRSDFPLPPGVSTATLATERMGPVLRPDLAGSNSDALPRLQSETRPDAWQAGTVHRSLGRRSATSISTWRSRRPKPVRASRWPRSTWLRMRLRAGGWLRRTASCPMGRTTLPSGLPTKSIRDAQRSRSG